MAQSLGLDCLGIAQFSPEALAAIPPKYAVGAFARVFGDAMPNITTVVTRGCPLVRIQLIYHRDKKYGDADIPTLKAEAKRWDEFAKKHKGCKVHLSPFCEHPLAAPDKYLKVVADAAPNCVPVNSLAGGGVSGKYLDETHGKDGQALKQSYFYSFDGTDMLEVDVEAYKKKHEKAAVWFGWTANFNGVREADLKPQPPIDGRKDWPTGKLIRSLVYQMERQRGMAGLPAQWLWKSHAEDHGLPDVRTDKPVLIAPVKAAAAELVRMGKVVATGAYYGNFTTPGLYRYYFPEWGFETAQRVGNVPLDLRIGGKVYGTVNPAFRQGNFR